ncbi:GntR family transcriptional regulator [Tenuibacillus multivorans]|uniref:DNA-binding transcriptional regulator, GntR family n=1 Tax=Tenuibacillus multivorans TaxID=237069 RepID=A0A1H0ESI5_9BACI|nr:GntR family transcriptional regulator [Tenuibacillus multivorans]GEL76972.1 GntR family transcriptional regulator [Tenuibacillus multivorans]SDN85348.1 DNA-binding transcriptional regulator, GntR family [Tenuibacillus multivorans]
MNKKQKAYNYMKSKIIEGLYVPGQRIVINQLVKELETSAIPIREAVRQLEAEGLIEYQDNIGPVVTPIDESQYIETLTVLAILEGYATALSKDHLPAQELSNLKNINHDMMLALDEFDFTEFGALNRKFHDKIYQFCPNKHLVDTVRETSRKLDSIRVTGSTFHPKRAQSSIEEHERIIELLNQKVDFEMIEHEVRKHKMNTVAAYKNQKERTSNTNRFYF